VKFVVLAALVAGCGAKLDPIRSMESPRPVDSASTAACWERDVLPILRKNCLMCHGEGRVYDFSTLELARLTMDPMKFKVRGGQMPPSEPLDSSSRRVLFEWIDSGGPACAR